MQSRVGKECKNKCLGISQPIKVTFVNEAIIGCFHGIDLNSVSEITDNHSIRSELKTAQKIIIPN